MENKKIKSHPLVMLLPYLWPKDSTSIRVRVVGAIIALVIAKVLHVYGPLFFKDTVDVLDSNEDYQFIIPILFLVAYGISRILAVLFQELREVLFSRVAQAAIRSVALKVFTYLHGLSLKFHLDRRTGHVARVIERGAKGIEFLLSFVLFNIAPTLLELVLVMGILWGLFDWRYPCLALGTIGLYILYTLSITEWRLRFRRKMNEKDSESSGAIVDSLLNYETVKYFNKEEAEAARLNKILTEYEAAAVKSISSLSVVNIGQGAIIATGLVLLLIMGSHDLMEKKISMGDFVLINSYLLQLFLPLNFLGFVYRQIRQSLIDMEEMFSLLFITNQVADDLKAPALNFSEGEIVFDNVSFNYDEDRTIFKGLSFQVPAKHSIAIVGPSGSGKTTISRLIFRFYDPDEGRILINNQDIRDVTQKSLRDAVGIVPQDTVLFNETIGFNIGFGAKEELAGNHQAIRTAAEKASILEFIEKLPEGFNTRVGERGLKLSGGEKQRVAIARMILKDPALLILDEATSALDTATEREIQKSLHKLSDGRTTIIIAHRLSTIVHANQILVLSNGMIVEQGAHDQLIKQAGLYAEMWYNQHHNHQDELIMPESLENK